MEKVGLQPDPFIIRAIRAEDFRVIPVRIGGRKDLSAVPAVLFVPLSGAFPALSADRLGRSCFSWFYRGGKGFLADFLFCGVAFGSFAKVSASRRGRAFANVPNLGGTKNVTKNLCAEAFTLSTGSSLRYRGESTKAEGCFA